MHTMNKWLEILLGLVLIILPVWVALSFNSWGLATSAFIQGGLVVFIVMIGVLLLLLGISDLKD